MRILGFAEQVLDSWHRAAKCWAAASAASYLAPFLEFFVHVPFLLTHQPCSNWFGVSCQDLESWPECRSRQAGRLKASLNSLQDWGGIGVAPSEVWGSDDWRKIAVEEEWDLKVPQRIGPSWYWPSGQHSFSTLGFLLVIICSQPDFTEPPLFIFALWRTRMHQGALCLYQESERGRQEPENKMPPPPALGSDLAAGENRRERKGGGGGEQWLRIYLGLDILALVTVGSRWNETKRCCSLVAC